MDDGIKNALRLRAANENLKWGISFYPPITEPSISRKHVDGPLLYRLNGGLHWLSLRDRLLTKLGMKDAWDIELSIFHREMLAARAKDPS